MADAIGQYPRTYGEPVEVEIGIDDYADNPRNYNNHTGTQIDSIAASLRKLGQIKRVSVWRGVYVTGHATKEAAKKVGMGKLKALRFPDEWPEQAVNAWLIADNETARISDPDTDKLRELVEEYSTYDAELTLAMGFDEARFNDLLGIDGHTFVSLDFDAETDDEFAEGEQFNDGDWVVRIPIPGDKYNDPDFKVTLTEFCDSLGLTFKIARA